MLSGLSGYQNIVYPILPIYIVPARARVREYAYVYVCRTIIYVRWLKDQADNLAKLWQEFLSVSELSKIFGAVS